MKWRRARSLPRRWQRNHLINQYGAVCYLCSKKFEKLSDVTIDHWIPLSKGGADTLDNYRLAHYGCNQLKAAMTPDEFKQFQGGSLHFE